jgi:SNF2 family DNA or RNA helicase
MVCSGAQCPCCMLKSSGILESAATLIIAPAAILLQWKHEIQSHTLGKDGNPLNVIVYKGVKHGIGKTNSQANETETMHPCILATADIVLIDYKTLKAEIGHSNDNRHVTGNLESNAILRHRKRFRVVPSPLTLIKWWRICLDEAQQIKTPAADSARMAHKLEAHHRWCVSGTPVGSGMLADLYGLMLFLRFEPFSSKMVFDNCLSSMYAGVDSRIQCLLQNIFWRSTKANSSVQEQMRTPPQVPHKVMLQFSPIEKQFYKSQLAQTRFAANTSCQENGKLLNESLQKLRAACCHPQVGAHGISGSAVGTSVWSMQQTHEGLIKKARKDCLDSRNAAVLISNEMAEMERLQVEAKGFGVNIAESDKSLLQRSCASFHESLFLSAQNSEPTLVIGEATPTGSAGFSRPHTTMRDGVAKFAWKLHEQIPTELWGQISFKYNKKRFCKYAQVRCCVSRTFFQQTQLKTCMPCFRMHAYFRLQVLQLMVGSLTSRIFRYQSHQMIRV